MKNTLVVFLVLTLLVTATGCGRFGRNEVDGKVESHTAVVSGVAVTIVARRESGCGPQTHVVMQCDGHGTGTVPLLIRRAVPASSTKPAHVREYDYPLFFNTEYKSEVELEGFEGASASEMIEISIKGTSQLLFRWTP